MNIITDPNPILHEKCKEIKKIDKNIIKLAKEMANFVLSDNNSVGVSANQVGYPVRMSVIEFDPKRLLNIAEQKQNKHETIPLTILVNPKITWHSKEQEKVDEGCLSLPDFELKITRPKEVNVLAKDLSGNRIKVRAKNYLARIIQHEIDHLNGILITDKVSIKTDRIIFIGSGDFGSIILKRLIHSPFKPYLLITETDKQTGRGNKILKSEIKDVAEQRKMEVWQPNRISHIAYRISELKPDLIIVASYGQIIPKVILDSAKYGALNVHPSLLPKYRGATPIQASILNGDKTTGVTIMKMDEKLDHGPIINQWEIGINQKENLNNLLQKLGYIGGSLLINTLGKYLSGQLKPKKQKDENATLTKLIKKEDGKINWDDRPEINERKIRAYNPWPGAYTMINNKRLKISKAHLMNGKLIIDRVQLEGKKEILFEDFRNGWHKDIDFLSSIS